MAGETPITVVGNLTGDPELRFTPSGAAVANFTVASTPRRFDRQANDWKDGETLFIRCSVWREQAENAAESLVRGTRVVVTGTLVSRSWETEQGEKRTVMELEAQEVAPSLKYATAKVAKTTRSGSGAPPAGGQQRGGWGGQQPQQQQSGGQQDPWATSPQQQSGGWGGQQPPEEPPF